MIHITKYIDKLINAVKFHITLKRKSIV